MNIEKYSVQSGRLINEDGTTSNVVDLLGGGEPVSEKKHNINQYAPRNGRVIGEDGKAYNVVPILKEIGRTAKNLYKVTWSELKTLRDNGELIEGANYRITDYVTTTTQAETISAGHQFDIIVVADSANTLNENARAIAHDGDTYFQYNNLNAWKLKYCIDNDNLRFAWANTSAGKGVIYEMIDEFNNKCPYDFKNIQFKRYKITATSSTCTDLINGYYGCRVVNSTSLIPNNCTISTTDTVYRYTFDYSGKDYSLNCYHGSTTSGNYRQYYKYCYGNEIASYKINQKIYLNSIVFLNSSNTSKVYHNKLTGNNCYSNTFGNNCHSNTFGNYCYSNTFGNNCYYNTFGNNCDSNTFGNECHYNTFGNSNNIRQYHLYTVFDYDYGSWIEEEDENGDCIVTGVEGGYYNITDEGGVTYHLSIIAYLDGDVAATIYDDDVTTNADGEYYLEDFGRHTWGGTSSDAMIEYVLTRKYRGNTITYSTENTW